MRVTENMTMSMSLAALQLQQNSINTLEEEVSSGLKINEPSDNPVGAQQALELKGFMAATDQYTNNIQTGTTWLSQIDSTMTEMNNVLTTAQGLATQMANGTLSDGERQSAANEATQLKNEMISLGNTQIAGKYIFGGYKNDQPPFDSSGNFNGTDDAINIQIGEGSSIAINYSGGQLLSGGTSGTDVIGTLNSLVTALNNNDQQGVASALTGITASQQQIQAAQADVGARENLLQNTTNILSTTKDNLTQALSNTQDADYTQVLSNLSQQQTAYQATLEATAQISKLSLLDYMQ